MLTISFFVLYCYSKQTLLNQRRRKVSFLQNAFHKQTQKVTETKTTATPKISVPSYDFVEQYVLIDPKKLLANEEAFALCKKIPVAHETKDSGGWHICAQLHTSVMLPFIRSLRLTASEKIVPAKMRTVSVINLDRDKYIYVLPSITVPNAAEIHIIFDKGDENSWPFYMTPTIRKAVVEQVKIHTH